MFNTPMLACASAVAFNAKPTYTPTRYRDTKCARVGQAGLSLIGTVTGHGRRKQSRANLVQSQLTCVTARLATSPRCAFYEQHVWSSLQTGVCARTYQAGLRLRLLCVTCKLFSECSAARLQQRLLLSRERPRQISADDFHAKLVVQRAERDAQPLAALLQLPERTAVKCMVNGLSTCGTEAVQACDLSALEKRQWRNAPAAPLRSVAQASGST